MGWENQISILVENIACEEKDIATEIYEKDAKSYFNSGKNIVKFRRTENGSKVLFFSYERSKYLPDWVIEEISLKYKEKYFTVLGSQNEGYGGLAGIVKILNGKISDRYGFYGKLTDRDQVWGARQDILENPEPELIFQWFGKGKTEEILRELSIGECPKDVIDFLFSENLVEFSSEEEKLLTECQKSVKANKQDWQELEAGNQSK